MLAKLLLFATGHEMRKCLRSTAVSGLHYSRMVLCGIHYGGSGSREVAARACPEMSWQATEDLIGAVKEFGSQGGDLREIPAESVVEAVRDLCIKANTVRR